MGRDLRLEYPGAMYHVMSRGNEKQFIFKDKKDKEYFHSLFERVQKKYGVIIHSYVLMDNHYHILLETPHGNLSSIMKWLNVTYTNYFNRRHKRVGHLFQGRYKSSLVEQNEYMLEVSLYIHLNPLRAGMETKLGSYPYSSIKQYIAKTTDEVITVDKVLGEISKNLLESKKDYKKLLQKEKEANPQKITYEKAIIGSKEYIAKIKNQLIKLGKDKHPSIKKLTSISPEEIIQKVCEKLQIKEGELTKKESESQKAKKIIIYLLRNLTPLTNKETGKLFQISESGVTQSCYRLEKQMLTDSSLRNLIYELEELLCQR